MAETNIAETVVEYLSSQNVRHIFGVLAHTSFALGDAIAKRPHLRFVNSQHEGGAGNMALGYARAAKKPAVCLVSAGGGATNIVTAVAQAYKESVPLFVISSDINTASSSKGAWSSWHGMEHVRLFEPITKQSLKLERVEEIGSVLDSLFRLTTSGRQGPVFLIIPADLQAAALPEPLTFSPTAAPAAPSIDPRSAEMAVDLLLKATAPVVLVGTGVDWSGAQREVQELAELLSAAGSHQLYRERRVPRKSSAGARLSRSRRETLRQRIFPQVRSHFGSRDDFQRRDDDGFRPSNDS